MIDVAPDHHHHQTARSVDRVVMVMDLMGMVVMIQKNVKMDVRKMHHDEMTASVTNVTQETTVFPAEMAPNTLPAAAMETTTTMEISP